jgi:hypothetical protein
MVNRFSAIAFNLNESEDFVGDSEFAICYGTVRSSSSDAEACRVGFYFRHQAGIAKQLHHLTTFD